MSLFFCKKKEKEKKKEVVCLPPSVITDRSVDIFNGLHSSLSVAFLSTPLTYFYSSVLFSIFPLLPILCLSIDCAFITATGHLFLLCVSVLFFAPILFPTPVMFLLTSPAIMAQKAIKDVIKPESATQFSYSPSLVL